MITSLLATLLLQGPVFEPAAFVRTVDRSDGVSICQTASMRLSAPGKPDVWLIGVAHIGQKDYYKSVQSLLDKQDVVLFEGVRRKGSPSTFAKPNPKGPKPLYELLSDAIGLDFQLMDIDYRRPNWMNSDLSMAQLEALSKKGAHGAPSQFNMVEQMLDPNSPQTKMFGQFLASATPSMRTALKIFLIEQVAKIDTVLAANVDANTLNVLLTVRNKSVEDAIAKVEAWDHPPKTIGVFYGAAHMLSIEHALRAKYDYRPAEIRWMTFATANRNSLDDAGRQFLTVLEASTKLYPTP